MKLKCVAAECEARGEALPGYRFFMCPACLEALDDACKELDDARNDGRASLESEGLKL